MLVGIAKFFKGLLSGFRRGRDTLAPEPGIRKKPRGEGFVSTSVSEPQFEEAAPLSGASAGDGKTRKQDLLNYKEALEQLKRKIAGNDKPLNQSLEELAERWNPLYDPRAKADLVEDVNSLIRDFIRSIKKHFRVKPPDLARIENMARQLSEHEAFEKIRRKDALMTYIKLYIIKILGNLRAK
jgi:hypothetical protein